MRSGMNVICICEKKVLMKILVEIGKIAVKLLQLSYVMSSKLCDV